MRKVRLFMFLHKLDTVTCTAISNIHSPTAKLNALAANEKQWGINADEAMKAPATASTDVKWLKVEKQWIDRPKPNPDMKWPATVFDKTNKFGPFNGGGWAATKATVCHVQHGCVFNCMVWPSDGSLTKRN